MSFFGANGTPVWYIWWHLLWVSKTEWVLPYSHCGGKCNAHSPRSTSVATPINLLAAGIAASHFPTRICRGGSWLGIEQAITRTEDEHTTIVPATRPVLFVPICCRLIPGISCSAGWSGNVSRRKTSVKPAPSPNPSSTSLISPTLPSTTSRWEKLRHKDSLTPSDREYQCESDAFFVTPQWVPPPPRTMQKPHR